VANTSFIGPFGLGGNDTETKVDLIVVDPAPLTVDFTVSSTTGANPLQVAFQSSSTGSPVTAWSWDFGDGFSSTAQHPTHTYTLPGTHTVSLTGFFGQQGETEVKADLITVQPALLVADFGGNTAGNRLRSEDLDGDGDLDVLYSGTTS